MTAVSDLDNESGAELSIEKVKWFDLIRFDNQIMASSRRK